MGKRGRENEVKIKELSEVVEGLRDFIWDNLDMVKTKKARLESNKKESNESSSEDEESGSGEGSPERVQSSPEESDSERDEELKKKSAKKQIEAGGSAGNKENEAQIDAELAEVLGDDPQASKALEIKLHSSIHNRWKYWFQNGINKDDKENLLVKYNNPEGLNVPKLNPEILRKLPSHSKSRDAYMCKRQELAGSALTAIGSVMTTLIEEKESIDKVEMMEKLHDAGKLIVEMMNSQNKSRAAFIIAGLDKDSKSVLEDTKPEEFLFGGDLSEKFKQAQTIEKVASSIKKPFKPALNCVSLPGKRPFSNQAGYSNQGFQYQGQNRQRLSFRTKQPFNNRAPYQGYNNSNRGPYQGFNQKGQFQGFNNNRGRNQSRFK